MKINLTYATVITIALGILKHFFYFQLFNIPIVNFLTASEIIVSFSNDLILLFCFLIPVLSISLYFDFFGPKKEKGDPIPRDSGKMGFTAKVVCIVLILALIVTMLVLNETAYYVNLGVSAMMILWLLFLNETGEQAYSTGKFYMTYGLLSLFLIMSIVLIFIKANGEYRRVKTGKYFGTLITTNDSTYKSDSSSFYIGRTTNYLFIYNAKDCTSTVLPSGEVKRMILKSK